MPTPASKKGVRVVACFLLLDALSMTVLANNLYELPVLINEGVLDYHLVRPVSPLFILSFRDFAANSFVNLLIAMGLLVYYGLRVEGPVPPWGGLLLVTFLGVGFLLRYLVQVLTGAVQQRTGAARRAGAGGLLPGGWSVLAPRSARLQLGQLVSRQGETQ